MTMTTTLPDPSADAPEPVHLRDDLRYIVIEGVIGAGKTSLARLLAERFSVDVAQTTRILYGGSMKPDNSKALTAEPEIDGALIGGASLIAESFAAIAKG